MANELYQFLDGLEYWGVATDCYRSLQRVLLGVAAALVAGVVLGLLRSSLPRRLKSSVLVNFLFEAPKFPPPIAWIPFVILAFGVGEISACAIVFIGAFSPIFTSTYEAAEAVPAVIKDTARSLEIRGPSYLVRIVLMSSLPQIFTGLKVGFSMGWMSVIAAEMISGQSGLGYSIQLNRLNLRYDMVAVDVLLIGTIGFLLFQAVAYLDELMLPWRERSDV